MTHESVHDAELDDIKRKLAHAEELRKAWRGRAMSIRGALETVLDRADAILVLGPVKEPGIVVPLSVREQLQAACNEAVRISEDGQIVDEDALAGVPR